jgi:HEAT repeat protein
MRGRFTSLLLGAALGLAFLATAAGDDYEERRRPGRCHCHEGQGSWDYLRSPLVPPEDPPHCGLLIAGGNCKERPRPQGVSGTCWGHQQESCFWKRHAYSWKIRCSECWNDTECPDCDALIGGRDAPTRDLLAKRIASESRTLGPGVVVAISPHFYVVTNAHKRIKLVTRRGMKRVMSAHEVAHLYAQRCELAYADFMHWFGGDVNLHKPMAVYVVHSEDTRKDVGARYFGGEGVHMNYAFAYNDRIAEGFSGNGFVVGQQHSRNDNRMHGYCRHQIGHILFSCWQLHGGFEEECPRWAWVGAAHFLARLLPIHQEYATYCYGEGAGAEGPQTRWEKRVRQMAAGRMSPIETFFNLNSLSGFKYHDHLRSWSIMDLMLREDRERWLKLMERLRHKDHEGKAFQEALGIKPDQFHQRWKERVLGKRKTMAELRADSRPTDDEPGVRERERLRTTQDVDELAGLIRGLDVIGDLATLEIVLGHLDHPSDLIRETAHLVLLRTKEPKLLRFLAEQAIYESRAMVRAGAIRALGGLRHADARGRIESKLEDTHWLVRANAAHALEQIGDVAARPALTKALGERKPKTWIAIVDALASFGERDDETTRAIADGLDHRRWQVRLTATRALARIGTMAAMDPLIERYTKEGGRLKQELRAALKAVSKDDLGPRADTWRTWWEEQKKKHGGGLPPPPPEPTEPNPADERYADPDRGQPDDPHYYGRRIFSKSVCFVIDTSGSMELNMKVRPEDIKRLGDLPAEGTRDQIAKKALLDTISRLDPRTKLRIVMFNTDVKVWKRDMQPATPANRAAAESALGNALPDGETNFHGALKAALGLHGRPTTSAKLEDIPDTVYFLTDGRPTKGEITSMPELISWFADLNRFAKVDLTIIALGELNIDLPRLQQLADAVGGTLVHVRER